MKTEEKGWLVVLIQLFPELPGLLLLVVGLVIRYWAIQGKEWMYDTGGPGIFSNITWIRNTFGTVVAQRLNMFIAWGIIVAGIGFIALGIWLRIATTTNK
ncbi:hypothetical protein [Myroides sp. DW712]|uniref:hypothetical protein n=1 Tax=Myroides sp. DW712 TaxID=3389800 RepID=UPI00397A94EF